MSQGAAHEDAAAQTGRIKETGARNENLALSFVRARPSTSGNLLLQSAFAEGENDVVCRRVVLDNQNFCHIAAASCYDRAARM